MHKCGSENSGAGKLLGDGTVMIKWAGQFHMVNYLPSMPLH